MNRVARVKMVLNIRFGDLKIAMTNIININQFEFVFHWEVICVNLCRYMIEFRSLDMFCDRSFVE